MTLKPLLPFWFKFFQIMYKKYYPIDALISQCCRNMNTCRNADSNSTSRIYWWNMSDYMNTQSHVILFSTILLGTIFHVRWEKGFLHPKEDRMDLMSTAVLTIIAAWSGRVSVASLIKKMPEVLQWLQDFVKTK